MIEMDKDLCKEKLVEIDHMYIDFRATVLQKKLEALSRMKSLDDNNVDEA